MHKQIEGVESEVTYPPKPAKYMLLVFSVRQIPRALDTRYGHLPVHLLKKRGSRENALAESVRQRYNWANSLITWFGLLYGPH